MLATMLRASGGVFSPSELFSGGQSGAWYDPSDLSTLFQDSGATIAVTTDGDPVGYIEDKSGNGNHATQSNSAYRPVYRTNGTEHWIDFSGSDDRLDFLIPFSLWSSGLSYYLAYDTNSATYGILYSKSDGLNPWAFIFQDGSSSSGMVDVTSGSEPSISLRVDGSAASTATRDAVHTAVSGKHVQGWEASGATGSYTSSTNLGIGIYATNDAILTGNLYGLVWRESLLTQEKTKLEDWLSLKAGI